MFVLVIQHLTLSPARSSVLIGRVATQNVVNYDGCFLFIGNVDDYQQSLFWRYKKCLLLCVEGVFHPPLILVHSESGLSK